MWVTLTRTKALILDRSDIGLPKLVIREGKAAETPPCASLTAILAAKKPFLKVVSGPDAATTTAPRRARTAAK